MLALLALFLLLLSATGVVVSLMRLSEHILAQGPILERLKEPLTFLKDLEHVPGDDMMLVAVFLIASALSLRAYVRLTASQKTHDKQRYGPYSWQV